MFTAIVPLSAGTHKCISNTASCSNDLFSIDTNRGYTCACNSGYSGDGLNSCLDVDECKVGSDGCAANTLGRIRCYNTPGSFQCMCPPLTFDNGVRCVPAFTTLSMCGLPSNACANTDVNSECSAVLTVAKKRAFACKCKANFVVDGTTGLCVAV
jgi:hypothetical protein